METHTHDIYMRRCFDLAKMGESHVGTNPMVGCVIVHQGEIIGEGYHEEYGKAHAEVNALAAVSKEKVSLLAEATMYVSLEPCSHHGKTPPCAHKIVEERVGNVVISCEDPNPSVSGQGIEYLKNKGVRVQCGVLEEEGKHLIRKFTYWLIHKRPFVTLKWAQSANGKFGIENRQVWLSNTFSKVYVHRIRAYHAAIMVGTQTALVDKPALNTRLYPGPSPIRVIPDRNKQLDLEHPFFHDRIPTIIYSSDKDDSYPSHIINVQIDFSASVLEQILDDLAKRKINTLLVEGGAKLIKSFIKEDKWQEAIVFRTQKALEKGIPAPILSGLLYKQFWLKGDEVLHIQNAE